MGAVRRAYLEFAAGRTSLPHSTFLRYGLDPRDRIIALPAYLGGEFDLPGIKWISSVPTNRARELDRASAIIALNDSQTGRVSALLEGSIISAKRTAASAALAAQCLVATQPHQIGLVGLGRINFELLRFLQLVWPAIGEVHAHDVDEAQLNRFRDKLHQVQPRWRLVAHRTALEVMRAAPLTAFATTAAEPYMESLDGVASDAVILLISLRDFASNLILSANNVVDDMEHVCRAQTSVHVASEKVGHRDFATPLADLLQGKPASWAKRAPVIFSPFGLGVLDLAVAALTLSKAVEQQAGTVIEDFHPSYWAA